MFGHKADLAVTPVKPPELKAGNTHCHRSPVARQRGKELVQDIRVTFKFGVPGLVALTILSGCLSGSEPITEVDGGANSNSPPVLSGNPANSIRVGDSFVFQPNASDSDGDTLSFDIRNTPGWATFETASGRLTGTPLLGDEGVYSNVTITASDGIDTSSLMFSISVTSIGSASVTLSWIPPIENEDGTTLTDLAGYNIYYGDVSGTYPNSLRIDNPSISTYVVGNLTPRTYYFVATSFNSVGVESRFSNEAVKVAN